MDEPKPEPLPLDPRNVAPIGVAEPAPAAGNGAMGGDRSTVESAPVRPRARHRYRARTWALGLILAVVGAAVFYTVRYFTYAGAHPSTDDAYVQGDTTIISAKVFGRVSRVRVRGYEHVQKGQMLVELDPVDAQIAVHQAEAALTSTETQVAQAQAALIAQEAQTTAALAQARAADTAAQAHIPQAQISVTLQEGQLLAQLDQAQAALGSAEAQTLSARAQATAAAAQVRTARADVAAAQAARERSQRDYARSQALVAQGAIATQQLDTDKTNFEVADASYQAALAKLVAAQDQQRAAASQVAVFEHAAAQARANVDLVRANQAQVPMRRQDVAAAIADRAQTTAAIENARSGFAVVRQREAQVAAARAAVAQAQAQLDAARQQLAYTRVIAPQDAVVGSDVPIQPGQVVQPGQTLLTLVFSSNKWVQANFKETQLRGVRVGQPATVRVDLLGRTYHGRVERLGPATGAALAVLPPQNATGNFTKVVQRVPVRIALLDAPDTLQVGLSVEATVDTTNRRAVEPDADAGAR
jgi:membrane fusion protein, multidrug efflux system